MINPKHKITVDFIGKSSILKKIYDDARLNDFAEKWNNERPSWPELYCCIIERRVNLEAFEVGFNSICQNAKKEPRNDCIARLRDVNNVGTVFEIACLGSLIIGLGKSNLKELYPKFTTGKRGEGLFEIEGRNICFEASVLTFNDEDLKLFNNAKSRDGIGLNSISGGGVGRVIRKLEEKLERSHPEFPNIFLFSQYSCLPSEQLGIDAIKKYFDQYGKNNTARRYVGVFYFDRFSCLEWIENTVGKTETGISNGIIFTLKSSFTRVSSNCFKREIS